MQSYGSWPSYAEDEIDAAVSVLKSGKVNYWTGENVRTFEQEYADYIGCEYAVAVANGTLALELALHALGIEEGDEVIIPSRTFFATASAVAIKGAIPVFADVDLNSQCICPENIKELITAKTKAIIVVHLAGWPCAMDEIMHIAEMHKLFVIEDCAQAHGAQYKGKSVGSIGHVGTFSFCQDKIISTAGEGGMITTNDAAVWKKSWEYKDHGKNYDVIFSDEKRIGFQWVHDSIGSNYRLTEIQAAIGRIQLSKLKEWLKIRTRNAEILFDILKKHKALRIPVPPNDIVNAYYKFYIFLETEKFKKSWDRNKIMEEINSSGVPCFAGSCSEVYLEKSIKEQGLGPRKRHPNAQLLGDTSLMFLVHPTLTEENMHDMANTVSSVISEASE